MADPQLSRPASRLTSTPNNRRRAIWKQEEFYVIEINDWNWSFSFGINNARNLFPDEIYGDYRHLVIRGKMLRPKRLHVETTEITLIPRNWLNPGNVATAKFNQEPKHLTYIHLRKHHLGGVFSMPSDALSPLLTMLVPGKLRYFQMSGAAMFRGEAAIGSFSFHADYIEDDLPPETVPHKRRS